MTQDSRKGNTHTHKGPNQKFFTVQLIIVAEKKDDRVSEKRSKK
jgi:hypothetical protein